MRPDIVGVVLPDGVTRPDLLPAADFGVPADLGVEGVGRGGVGVVVRVPYEVGVGVVERPNGCLGLIYLGVPVLELVDGMRGLVGVLMFDDELLKRLDFVKLPDEPAKVQKYKVCLNF